MAAREKGGHLWSTEDELRYLHKLGTWSEAQRLPRSREDLLQQYRLTMRLRQEWGTMDQARIRREVRALLQTTPEEASA